MKVASFLVDIVGSAAESPNKHEGSVADGRHPDCFHPGGYL